MKRLSVCLFAKGDVAGFVFLAVRRPRCPSIGRPRLDGVFQGRVLYVFDRADLTVLPSFPVFRITQSLAPQYFRDHHFLLLPVAALHGGWGGGEGRRRGRFLPSKILPLLVLAPMEVFFHASVAVYRLAAGLGRSPHLSSFSSYIIQ